MEKRRVTVSIGGQYYSFYSDDSDEYISLLEQRVNAAMKQTAGFSGENAVLAVIYLTDQLLRTEAMSRDSDKQPAAEPGRKNAAKAAAKAAKNDAGQISVWELLGDDPKNQNA